MRRKYGNVAVTLLHKEIYKDIMQGMQFTAIVNKILNNEYVGCKEVHYAKKSAERMVCEVKTMIKKDFEKQRNNLREDLTAILMDILAEARKSQDRSASLKAVEQIAKLTGANEPTKVEAKVENVTIDFGFGDDDKNEDEG